MPNVRRQGFVPDDDNDDEDEVTRTASR
jgi:hypothetical protein